MVTQKVRPDKGRDERQQAQRRQVIRTIKVGTLAIAAIAGAIAVLIPIVAVNEGQNTTAAASAAGGGGTDQAGTGPSVIAPTDDDFPVGFKGLPPEGATPSAPLRGDLVKSYGGVHPWAATPWTAAYLYADGRLIWAKSGSENTGTASAWIEQRLTPKGVHFLSENPLFRLHMRLAPYGAWRDSTLRPYVPSRYAIVGWTRDHSFSPYDASDQHQLDFEDLLSLLPARARDLLRGAERIAGPGSEVTTEDARALAEILDHAGYGQAASGDSSLGVVAYSDVVTFGIDIFRHLETVVIEFHAVLPDGQVPSM